MGWLSKKPERPRIEVGRRVPGSLPAGWAFDSALPQASWLELAQNTIEAVRPRRYPELSNLVPAHFKWLESTAPPESAWSGEELGGEIVLFTLRSHVDGPGTRLGVFPLREIPTPPALMTELEHLDGTLSLLGPVKAGTVSYAVPKPSKDLPDEICAKGGYPASPDNIAAVAHQFMIMASIKGSQFYERIAGPSMASAKVSEWGRWTDRWGASGALGEEGVMEPVGMVLRDLAAADADVIPFLQDFLPRIAAIMLVQPGEAGTFWENLNR